MTDDPSSLSIEPSPDYPDMLFLVLLSCLIASSFGLGDVQSVGVRGVLKCDDKPAKDVKVKIYDGGGMPSGR